MLFEGPALRHQLGDRGVRRMLYDARMPRPGGWPPMVTVWRGGL
ncbi:hypothetical protein [Elioraea sp.]